jgi:hypothetical protein
MNQSLYAHTNNKRKMKQNKTKKKRARKKKRMSHFIKKHEFKASTSDKD